MTLPRRRFLSGAAAVVASPWLGERPARRRRRRASRSASPPASRAPTAWCSGPGSRAAIWPARETGALGARRRRSASRASSPAARRRPRPPGRTASTPSRPGSTPGRWYWYRFSALGERARSAARAPRRAADAAATLRFAIASCQRFDVGHYAAWRHVAARRPRPGRLPRRLHLRVRDPQGPGAPHGRRRGLHARPVPRPLRDLQGATRPAGGARGRALARRLGRPRGLERLRRRSRPGPRRSTRARAAPRRTAPTGSTCRFRSRRGRSTPTCASSAGSTGAGWRASTSSTTASTATPRSARGPTAAARTRSRWRSARR